MQIDRPAPVEDRSQLRTARAVSLVAIAGMALAVGCASDDTSLERCAAIEESAARLACYDAAQSDGAADSAASTSEPGESEEGDFGFEARVLPKTPDQITSAVARVSRDPFGKLTLTLENGQVWKQIDTKRLRIRDDSRVVIRKAALRSFLLHLEGSKTSIRVRRLE